MMAAEHPLTLEVLSGPLDGSIIVLETTTEWSRDGDGPLAFPWDAELGVPQARFILEQGRWYLEGLEAAHGTYRVNREERLTGRKVVLEREDILKASRTWLLVRQA